MCSISPSDLVGKRFDLRVPQTNAENSPCWLCHCSIETVTETDIHVRFTCQGWLQASFTLPIPKHLDTVFNSIYISCCVIVAQERIEYLCTL